MKSNTIQLIANGIMTGTATIESDPIPLDQIFGYAVQAVWTGTPVGELKLQASSESPPRQNQVSNGGPDEITLWDDIADSDQTLTGVAGSFMWNVNTAYYRYFRLVYTNVSGVGSLTAIVSLKGM